jgi:hypothetical protein
MNVLYIERKFFVQNLSAEYNKIKVTQNGLIG